MSLRPPGKAWDGRRRTRSACDVSLPSPILLQTSNASNSEASSSGVTWTERALAMRRQLSPASTDILRRYASRAIDLRALSEWLVQVEYDDDLSPEERDALARIRLTAIEAAEGLCPEAEVVKDVSSMLVSTRARAGRQPA